MGGRDKKFTVSMSSSQKNMKTIFHITVFFIVHPFYRPTASIFKILGSKPNNWEGIIGGIGLGL